MSLQRSFCAPQSRLVLLATLLLALFAIAPALQASGRTVLGELFPEDG